MDNQRVSRAPVVVVIVFAVVAVVLVFIGMQRPGEAPPDVDIAQAGTAEDPRELAVIMRDYRFDPTPVILVPGETVRIRVINGGLDTHDFVLGDDSVQQAWAMADALATPPSFLATSPPASVPPDTGGVRVLLGSGDSAVIDYVVPEGEQLQLLCHIPGHIEKGMVGAVELREVADA